MTNDAFDALVDGPIGDCVWCNADPECDCPGCTAVRAVIAHARECREALRMILEEEHPHEPHCTPYAGANQHLTHGPCTCHVAAVRRCLGGGT